MEVTEEKKAFEDRGAEIASLAGICQYGGDAFIDVSDLVDASAYTDRFCSSLFKCFEYIYKNDTTRKVDVPTILAAAKAVGVAADVDQPENIRHLRALFKMPIERETVRREAGRIVKLRIAETLDAIAAQARRDLRKLSGDESLNVILQTLESPLFEYATQLNRGDDEGPGHIAKGVDDYLTNLEENPRENVGIPTCYPVYNSCIGGGYRRATVSIVAARPKSGKTVFVDNVAMHVAGVLKIPVLNLDTEMTREEHLARILSMLSGIEIKEIETGWYAKDPAKKRKVREAAEYLKTIPYEYDSVINKSFEEQVAIIRRWTARNVGTDERGVTKDCLVLYDYLQLTDASEFGSGDFKEYQILGFQMLTLLRLAARCDIPILSMLQMNREGIDKETTGTAAGSDRIIWKCANFTILKRKSIEELAEDGPDNGNTKLVPIIARHGEAIAENDYINLHFDRKTAKLTEGKTRNEVAKTNRSKQRDFDIEVEEDEDADMGGEESKPKTKRGRKPKREPKEVPFD